MPRKKTEIKNPPNTKGRNPRVSKDAKEAAPDSKIEAQPKCHIHDKVEDWEVDEIRENVCVNDEPLTKHTDGKHYCLFHLPTKDKDIAKFEEIFRARLDAVKKKVAEIEKLPEEKRAKEKRKLKYDFHYVWFPSDVYLINYKFAAVAYFSSATFAAVACFCP